MKNKPISEEDRKFMAGFISERPNKHQDALRLAKEIRRFMAGLPSEMQIELHNAALALEEWGNLLSN